MWQKAISAVNGGGSLTEMTALIPTMTSDTTPSGGAHLYARDSSTHAAYKAFDGNISTFAGHSGTDNWVAYKFPSAVSAKVAILCAMSDSSSATLSNVKIDASNNFVDWQTLGTFTTISDTGLTLSKGEAKLIPINPTIPYQTYRVSWTGTTYDGISMFQIYD